MLLDQTTEVIISPVAAFQLVSHAASDNAPGLRELVPIWPCDATTQVRVLVAL